MKPGIYKAKAIDFDFGYTNSGTEQIAICLCITEGECQDETITWYGYFTDKAAPITIRALRALGWDDIDLAQLHLKHLAQQVSIVVEQGTDLHGAMRLRVAFINRDSPREVRLRSPMTQTQKQAFAARMRRLCQIASEAPNAARQQGHGNQPAPYADDDQVPF